MNQPGSLEAAVASSLAEEVIRTFGEIRLRAFGTSMVPSILPGDVVSIQRVAISDISAGDIVLYARAGRLYVHRVVARCGELARPLVVTRGDRLGYDDPPVSSDELLGRVVAIQAGNGSGERDIQPLAANGVWNRMAMRVLKSSNYATYIYLHLIARGVPPPNGRLSCQA